MINGLFRTEEIENNSQSVPQQFKIKRFDRKYTCIINFVLSLQKKTLEKFNKYLSFFVMKTYTFYANGRTYYRIRFDKYDRECRLIHCHTFASSLNDIHMIEVDSSWIVFGGGNN